MDEGPRVASRHLAWPWHRVLLAALALALLSEGLQFFALDRYPSLLDVGIDMAGAGLGLLTRRMVALGPNLGEPHTKAFGEGLFELKFRRSRTYLSH